MKTKYIYYPLLMMLAILLPTSCSVDNEIDVISNSIGEKVRFNIGVSLAGASEVESRAFGDGAESDSLGTGKYYEFENLYVAVFEKNEGVYYFRELVKADDIEPNTPPTWNGTNWNFSVELTKRTNPCRLHLIANYDGLTMGFNEEGQLMGLLETQGVNHDVYWNFISLEGIADNTVASLASNPLPLVRNYVQIRLKTDGMTKFNEGFTITRYGLVNVPTRGTVAAYNSLSTNKFANFVKSDRTCQSYTYMYGIEKYEGNEPYDDGSLLNKDIVWKNPSDITYMYERKNRDARNPTCMLIEGKLGDKYTYYKLDFVYEDSETKSMVYYNLLRNFIYTMNVTSVGGLGYDRPEEALNQPSNNNIGGDVLAESYTNISNGVSQLFVSTTYMLLTSTEQNEEKRKVELYYRSIPNIQSGEVNNNMYSATNTTGVTITYLTGSGHVLSNAVCATNNETSGQYAGWRKITLTHNVPSATDSKIEELIIAANGIQRKVKLLLRNREALTVVVPETVASVPKTEFNVTITLPKGLDESLFPLRLFISSEKNTIFPKYGSNMPAEVRDGVYGFIKEVSYSDAYNEDGTPKDIICPFLTNCVNSATTIFVENQYLATARDAFENEKITSLSIAVGHPVTIQQEAITTGGMMGMGGTTNYYYPQKINNGGVENVTVTFNGETKTFTIDENGVTTANNVVWNNTNGFDSEAVLTFTFEDNYISSWMGNVSWNNQATYTATCTVGELLSGTTLNFTR